MTDDQAPGEVTRLLAAHADGDEGALGDAFSIVYDELRKLAHHKRRSAPSEGTLNTTGLVHEAYVKLAGGAGASDRGHLLNLVSRAMRQVLIDYARARRAEKRGGDVERVALDAERVAVEREADTLIALDQALVRMAKSRPRQAQVFVCRYFGGLDAEQAALAVGTSVRTVEREWLAARTWLKKQLRE